MDFLSNLESWDYLAGIVALISLWLIMFGIKKLLIRSWWMLLSSKCVLMVL